MDKNIISKITTGLNVMRLQLILFGMNGYSLITHMDITTTTGFYFTEIIKN